jgi:TetR/AcrR family transcriptional regulator
METTFHPASKQTAQAVPGGFVRPNGAAKRRAAPPGTDGVAAHLRNGAPLHSGNGASARSGKSAAVPRMRAAERRRHLIGVAVRLFAARGFSGTTTKAIAEGGGVSEAIIFRHFKSKEDLYGAILREKARQYGYREMLGTLRRFARRGEDERLVFHLVLHTLESFEKDPDFHRLMLHAALERPDLVKVGRRILGMQMFKLLCGYVTQRQKAGAFRKGPPELLAFGILALPMHFGMVTQVIGVKRMHRPMHELAAIFTEIILDGMQVPRGSGGARNGATVPRKGDGAATGKQTSAAMRTHRERGAR